MRAPVRLAALLGMAAGLGGCVYQAPTPSYSYAPGAYGYAPYGPGASTATGALVGAGAGAALGGIAGGGQGAAIGALAGGALGAAVGASGTPEYEAQPPAYYAPDYGYGYGY